MNFKNGILAAAMAVAILPAHVQAAENPSVDTVLATVDGTKITLGNVIALRERLPQQYKQLPDDVLLKGIIDQLIQQTVLMNAMKANMDKKTKIGLENQERAFLAAEFLDRMSAREIPDKDLRAAYAAKYDSAIPEQEYNASHILVKTKAEAEDIIKQLKNGADFATLAKEKSTGPSGKRGGELGWFSKGMMVKPFETAVLNMGVGEISGPVKTQFGWHVIKLNEIRNKKQPTFEEERDTLAAELRQKAVDAEIARLTKAAKVTREKVDIDPKVIRDVSLLDK